MYDYLIVGAGFAGSVLAERLAQDGNKILIVEKRNHIGGNAYDYYNEDGVLVHKYGAHIFHTNSADVFEYLSQFTEWDEYQHRVLASVDGKLVPIPINLDTINILFNMNLTSLEVKDFLETIREHREPIVTSEDVVVNVVGLELYEKFFKNYTKKQWDLYPSELDKSVTARVPTRTDRDDRYFKDKFQVMPKDGYTRMFEKMLDHENISIMLQTDYLDIIDTIPFKKMIYTGTIDSFFNYQFGKLPYRSLRFNHETHNLESYQPAAVINYPNEQPYTRVVEWKKMTGQQHHKTSIMFEYPMAEGEPYYPIPRAENKNLYHKYKKLADSRNDVVFVGRLATYQYYDMHQVVAQALATYKKLSESK